MAGRKLEYDISVDSSKGISGVKQFSSTVKKELKSIEGDFDDTATSGEKVATVLSRMAKELDSELDRAAQAADALATALGPELAGKADVGQIVGDLQKMDLSFEDIVADADKLAASLKELDQVQVKGLDAGLGNVDTKLGNIGRSAGGSRSVLANMVGNTTQDLGALAGVAGSAGVAIGQMGEYMADAAGEGEGFGGILKNFGTVAVPLAAIGVTTAAIAGHFKGIAATDAFNKEQIEGFSEALREGATEAEAIAQHLEEAGKVEFRLFDDTQDLGGNLAAVGLNIDDFSKLAAGGADDIHAWGDAMLDAGASSKDVNLVMLAATKTAENLAGAHELAAINAQLFTDALDPKQISDATREFLRLQDPVEQLPDTFLRMGRAISTGFRPTLADIQKVKDELGIELPEALELGKQAWDDYQAQVEAANEANKETADAATQAWDDFKDGAQDAALEVADTEAALRDMAGVFKKIGTKGDALQRVFDLGNAPLEARNSIYDIEAGIDDLRHFLREEGVPDIFDPDDVDAGPFLDKIAALRDPIQAEIIEAFSAGGPEAARAVAESYVGSITEEMRGRLTPEQVEALLGITDLEAQIKVAIEQTSLANAQLQLDILTGLGGQTPLTASIALALNAGAITPRQAQILIQDALRGEGVEIPAALDIKEKPGALARAQQALQESADANPIEQDLVAMPTGLREARQLAQQYMDDNPATLPVQPVFVGMDQRMNTALAAAGFGAGTTAAPTATARGGAPVAVPMAGPTLPTLTLPVAGATARQPVVINNYTTLQAAVIGDPFAVAQAVEDAGRRNARLQPTVP